MPFRQRIARHLGETVSSRSLYTSRDFPNRHGDRPTYKTGTSGLRNGWRDGAQDQSVEPKQGSPSRSIIHGRVKKGYQCNTRSLTRRDWLQLSPEQKYLSCKIPALHLLDFD